MIKLSVNETKWRSLLARTHALILYISFWIFDFGPVKLPGLSRNGPQDYLLGPYQRPVPWVDRLIQLFIWLLPERFEGSRATARRAEWVLIDHDPAPTKPYNYEGWHPVSSCIITGSPSSKYEHRRTSALLRNILNLSICMGKKPIVSVTYENERISIKNSLP